uniref:Lecithin:cholesterol acyltransferase n=1 Tax=Vannella robusta TaxID=1487602 RepID=A0A7S4MD71_9EUKA
MMIDIGEAAKASGTSSLSFKDTVNQQLASQSALCVELVNLLRQKTEESFSLFRLTGLFKDPEVKFSAKQAYQWLVPEFPKRDLEWGEDHVPYVIEFLWDKRYIDLKEHDPDFVTIADDTEFIFSSPIQSELRALLASHNTPRLGIAMSMEGKEPQYPVVIVPGLGSSALSVWESDYRTEWVGERLWLDFSKVGTEIKLPTLWKSPEKTEGDYGMFVRHMLLADDGYSDPPGVRVRPMEGLEAVASLSPVNRLTTGITTIFGELIKNLLDIGYDRKNIAAAPYDWRLPIQKLEERDSYFTSLKSQIVNLYNVNGEKRVVLICHSNGNRVAHYFTHWMENREPGWCKKYIHGFIALAAPYLGAPKMARAIVTGDALGLDIVLVEKAQEAWGRHMGSYPALLPLQEHLLPTRVLMLYTGSHAETNQTDSPSVLSHQERFHPTPERGWQQFQRDEENEIPEEESAAFTQITARVLAGVWLIDHALCEPKVPDDPDDYLPELKGWARDLLLKLIVFMDRPKQEISTAKNGFKETTDLPNTKKKSVAYPFDHEKKIKSVNVTRTTRLSINGKQIITEYFLPKGYTLKILIGLTEEANTMKKRIIISKKDTIIGELVRFFRRETPFSLVQQCLDEHDSEQIGNYSSPTWRDFIARVIPASYQHFDEFFVRDEFIFGKGNPEAIYDIKLSEEEAKEYPILNPPVGIDNLWCIYGRDRDTEISYYLSKKIEDHSICYHLGADEHSLSESENNPSGVAIKEGIGFETSTTPQPCLEGEPASGDGTVPYYSLSYCKNWKHSTDVNVEIIEVPGQEHTDMLKDDQVIFHVLKYLCDGENPYSS